VSGSLPLEERMLVLLLAFLHLQQGAPQKAETLYGALLALDPQDAEAAKGLGSARLAMGKALEALAVLDTIVGPGEPSALVQLLRARAFARLGQLEDARVAMRAFGALRRAALPPDRRTPAPARSARPQPLTPVPAGS
jgi:tetratricopeptide (TPR) repeat protein